MGTGFTVGLENIRKDSKKAGGKGANLGEMIQAGLPIPPGFVVSIDAYDVFVRENNLGKKIEELLEKTDPENPNTFQQASREIKTIILNSNMPIPVEQAIKESYEELSVGKEVKQVGGAALDMIKAGRNTFVAVRSSATAEDMEGASFAGQMETLLNIQGEGQLLQAVKECWASLYTPRAMFYRESKGIKELPSMGVIVQRMVNSDKSGVVFTAEPTTGEQDKILIEAAWGLGESVVSGAVVPDIYILEKSTGNIIEKTVSNKRIYRTRDPASGKTVELSTPADKARIQVLDETEIAKLWELAVKDENHYNGKPQDIEWCQERGRMFLVQTRPITTIGGPAARTIDQNSVGEVLLEGLSASPGFAEGPVKIVHTPSDLDDMKKGEVLVAKMTNPDFVPYMKIASAIVTDEGGKTSHAAIVSRELGIPCVVGTGSATTTLKEGQTVTVDGAGGKIYSGTKAASGIAETPAVGEAESHAEPGTTVTEIKANIAFPETAERVVDRTDGVGLLRAEHMLTESGKHPIWLARNNPEELIQTIVDGVGRIAKVFYPKPVWYRTLDARTDEFRNLEGGENEPQEANPMLGWHGIRRSLDEPDVFRCEIEAIERLKNQGLDNVAVMLPFVIKVEEFKKAKEMIGFPLKLGIMVETPAAVQELEAFCRAGIDFVSIGSNDLTQLVLGVDRGNTRMAELYNELDPAVVGMIKCTIQVCRENNVECSICGEAGSNPVMAEKLITFGINSISCEMDAVDTIRNTAVRTERKLLLDMVRNRQVLRGTE